VGLAAIRLGAWFFDASGWFQRDEAGLAGGIAASQRPDVVDNLSSCAWHVETTAIQRTAVVASRRSETGRDVSRR
jgi:hypothetical protein